MDCVAYLRSVIEPKTWRDQLFPYTVSVLPTLDWEGTILWLCVLQLRMFEQTNLFPSLLLTSMPPWLDDSLRRKYYNMLKDFRLVLWWDGGIVVSPIAFLCGHSVRKRFHQFHLREKNYEEWDFVLLGFSSPPFLNLEPTRSKNI